MIVDAHAYVGPWAFRHLPHAEPAAFLARLDHAGIDCALVSPTEAILYKDVQPANRLLASRLDGLTDRLRAVPTLNPLLANWEADWAWCRHELQPVGIRLHPNYHGYRCSGPEAQVLIDVATQDGLPIFVTVRIEDERTHHPLVRVPPVAVEDLAAAIRAKPNARFVVCGARLPEIAALANQAPRATNYVVEISHLQHPLDALDRLRAYLPLERIWLGSGMPFLAPESAVYKILSARLDDAEKAAVLGGNAAPIVRESTNPRQYHPGLSPTVGELTPISQTGEADPATPSGGSVEPRYEKSLALFARHRQLVPGGSQTNSKRPTGFAFGSYPIFASHARGSHVWDVDGNEYVDFVQALGPIILGYRDPDVDAAVRTQLEKGIVYGLLAETELEAAETIVDAVPCAEMVRFLKSGAEATSAAARIARAYTGREVIVNCGYRGWHDGWNVGRNDGGIPRVLEGVLDTFSYNDLESLESVLAEHAGQVAAVFLDAASYQTPTEGFLQGVARLTHEHGALLVFDEIVTGFRLALGGAQQYYGVIPDIACFAKAIANGMPLSAVCGRREVMEVVDRLVLTTTYGGEALSLAAATTTIRKLRHHRINDQIWRTGQRLIDGLNEVAAEAGVPFRCTGLAPMSAMVFEGELAARSADCWYHFLKETARHGVLFRRGGLNFIVGAHTDSDVDRAIEAARVALKSLPAGRDRLSAR
jgi:glutamate-1-semialdehyde 2,1-aminomutase